MQFYKNKYIKKFLCLVAAFGIIMTFSACNGNVKANLDENSLPPIDYNEESSSEISEDEEISEPVPEKEGVYKNIDEAKEINSDTVGWIQIPNTKIDNEILQTNDNDYYLRRDISKEYNWYGCYYADYECVIKDRASLSPNTVIYGHNVDDDPNGKKFSELLKYLNLEFAKNNPYIYIYTPTEKLVFKVFAVYYTDIGFQYHLINPVKDTAKFDNKMSVLSIAEEAKKRSQMVYDVDVNERDKLLTLSTCTYKYGEKNEEQRFVVQARLLREGEEERDTVSVKKNPSPKEPTFRKNYD